MKAVFDPEYIRRITGTNVKQGRSKMDKAEMLMEDIQNFRESNGVSRMAMIWCGSTEVFHRPAAVHQSLREFECGLQKNDPDIAPSQIYAYAALKSGVPYANGAPNLTTDTPALLELARERFVTGDYMTDAVYPTLLHQDPRYFRQGTGSGWSRLCYAMGQIFFVPRRFRGHSIQLLGTDRKLDSRGYLSGLLFG